MKLLKQFDNEGDAQSLYTLLKENGIASYISGEAGHNYKIITGTLTIDVSVILNEQYEDANLLIKNPHHKVLNKLTPEEIKNMEEHPQKSISKALTQLANKLMVGILAALGIFIFSKIFFSH